MAAYLAGLVIIAWVAMVILAAPNLSENKNGMVVAGIAFTLTSVALALITLINAA